MSDVEQWEHDEQRAMETEITTLREQVKKLKAELKSIDGALDDPRANLTLTTSEIIWELKEQVEKLTKERDDLRSRRCEVCGYLEHEREHTGCLREQLAALAEQNEKMREALQKLACLGNGEQYGNSIGNCIAQEALSLPDLATPVLNRIKESNDDVLVMDALRSGEWRITKSIPCECLTDEANAKSAWYVERMCAPFCDDKNLRSWFGRTPIEALSNGKDAIRALAAELEKESGK